MSFSSFVESTEDSKLSLSLETSLVPSTPLLPSEIRFTIYKYLDANCLFTKMTKLSRSERSFIKEYRSSSIPRILRVVSPSTGQIDFFDTNSMAYMFDFADKINLDVRGSRAKNLRQKRMEWTEFFMRRLPLSFQSGILELKANINLKNILMYFKRLDEFIQPQVLSFYYGKVKITKKNQALSFLYGC
jgi:hypothetical protein